MSRPDYRPEVDGLRAFAVLVVILFHAGLPAFSGGFVGVDAFFVISGYVITLTISQEMAAGDFTFRGFYERRARRILPALVFVVLCCFPFALALLAPPDFLDFSKSVASLSLFASNIYFFLEGNYFAPAADLRPLLHTWSLAIEEQFYFVYPPVLLLLWRRGLRTVFWLLVITAAIGVGITYWQWPRDPQAAFYLPHTRMWELQIGAICAIAERLYGRPKSEALAVIGAAMLVFAVFVFDESTPQWISTFVPTAGAGLLIMFGRPGTWSARALSLRGVVGIGLLSYSAYLWHQPLLAFARIYLGNQPNSWILVLIVIATFALAAFSWRFIEQPFRKRGASAPVSVRAIAATSLASLILFAAGGAYGMRSGGLTPFNEEAAKRLDQLAGKESGTRDCSRKEQAAGKEFDVCTYYFAPHAKRIAVVGDSHAATIAPGFAKVAQERGWDLYHVTIGGCPPVAGGYILQGQYEIGVCPAYGEKLIGLLRELDVAEVVLVGNWTLYSGLGPRYQLSSNSEPVEPESYIENAARLIRSTVDRYEKAGIKTYIMRQVPWQKFEAKDIYAPILAGDIADADADKYLAEKSVTLNDHRKRQERANLILDAVGLPAERYIDLTPFFCPTDICLAGTAKTAYYRDTHHISFAAAQMMAPHLAKALPR